MASTIALRASPGQVSTGRPTRRTAIVVAICIAVAAALAFSVHTWRASEEREEFRLASEIPTAAEGFSLALYQSVGVALRPGHEVGLVSNGAVFDAIAREIRSASSSVHVDVYIWQKGAASDKLLAALAERKPGVACRVVVDELGSTNFDDEVRPALVDRGCDVRIFRPLAASDDAVARNHRKLVVVDGRVAFTGGFGIKDEWLGDGVTAEGWRDTNISFTGPAVIEAQQAIAENWQESGGALFPPEAFPLAAEKPGPLAALVTSTGAPTVTRAERLMHLVMRAATKRLWIANAYFVPPESILSLMKEKARAGVDVRLLVPGKKTDSKISMGSQHMEYGSLVEAGIRTFEYEPSMMHAKTIVADDDIAVVGSINLEPLSLGKLEEDALVVHDRAFAGELARSFEQDCSHARQIQR